MPVSRGNKRDVSSGLAFIHVSHPDEIRQRSTQRAVRSGAMAAIGRARRRRPVSPVTIQLDVSLLCGDFDEENDNGNSVDAKKISPAMPHLGMFAVEPDNRARELLHFMSGEASYVYRPFRVEWFYLALLDPSSYFLCLANAALFMNQYIIRRKSLEYTDSAESAKYYSKCLTQVTQKLACEAERFREGVITTVLGFVCHSISVGHWDRCEMHMQGLERIIHLRGGFQGLCDFLPRFASWFDIVNSTVQDILPRFPYPAKAGDDVTRFEELSSSFVSLLESLEHTCPDVTALQESLTRMAHLANYVNVYAQQPPFWEAGMKSTNLLGPTAHSLLLIPRLDLSLHHGDDQFPPALLLKETVRIALFILMASLKRGFSLGSDELGLFLERFSAITPLVTGIGLLPELRLWANLVVSCARKDSTPLSQISEIRRAMRDLGIQKIEDAVMLAKSIIWIPCLLDRAIERVTEQITQESISYRSTS